MNKTNIANHVNDILNSCIKVMALIKDDDDTEDIKSYIPSKQYALYTIPSNDILDIFNDD